MKFRYGMRTLLATCACVAGGITIWRYARTDTFLHTPSDAILQFPTGDRFLTNRWICVGRGSIDWVVTDVGYDDGNVVIGHNGDSRDRALLIVDGKRYEAVLTHFVTKLPHYVGEYWLRPGQLVDKECWGEPEP